MNGWWEEGRWMSGGSTARWSWVVSKWRVDECMEGERREGGG
jgi:hypothetical protein